MLGRRAPDEWAHLFAKPPGEEWTPWVQSDAISEFFRGWAETDPAAAVARALAAGSSSPASSGVCDGVPVARLGAMFEKAFASDERGPGSVTLGLLRRLAAEDPDAARAVFERVPEEYPRRSQLADAAILGSSAP